MHPQSHNQLRQGLQIGQLILKDESILTGQVGVNIPPPPNPPISPPPRPDFPTPPYRCQEGDNSTLGPEGGGGGAITEIQKPFEHKLF